jgi:hypothetical protein
MCYASFHSMRGIRLGFRITRPLICALRSSGYIACWCGDLYSGRETVWKCSKIQQLDIKIPAVILSTLNIGDLAFSLYIATYLTASASWRSDIRKHMSKAQVLAQARPWMGLSGRFSCGCDPHLISITPRRHGTSMWSWGVSVPAFRPLKKSGQLGPIRFKRIFLDTVVGNQNIFQESIGLDIESFSTPETRSMEFSPWSFGWSQIWGFKFTKVDTGRSAIYHDFLPLHKVTPSSRDFGTI